MNSEISENELVKVLGASLYPGAADESIRLVLGYCKAIGFDPMLKPCHIVPMWDSKQGGMRDVVMPGIGMYRIQAARSGCAGISEAVFGPDETLNLGGVQVTFPKWATVTVKRRLASGEIVDFTSTERWIENYATKGGKEKSLAPNAMWFRRPYAQLAKCAEAQALRKAFPEIGAAPTADEMEGKDFEETPRQFAPAQLLPATSPTALPECSDEKFAQNLPAWRGLIESGDKTPEQLLAKLRRKCTFTPEQVAIIEATMITVEEEGGEA